jgi:hypothetical protein
MKRVLIWTVVAMMALTGVAMAGTEGGDKEIQIQGSLSNTTNSDNDNKTSTSSIQLGFNYFFTSNVSIGVDYRGIASYDEPENGDKSTTSANFLLLRGDLYLGSATSKLMPYIGGHVGQASITMESGGNKNSFSSSTYGFQGGIKIFSGENISWNLELDQSNYTYKYEDYNVEYDEYVTSFFAGFSYYF